MTGVRNLLLRAGAIIAVALAAGCASLPSVNVPREVKVPVPVACVEPAHRPQRPALRTPEDLMLLDRYARTIATWSSYERALGYVAELEAVVEGCSRIPAVSRPP